MANDNRVTTKQHYEAIMDVKAEGVERERRIGSKIDKGFERLEKKLVHRIELQDARIDRVVTAEKVIGSIAVVWPGLAAVLARMIP